MLNGPGTPRPAEQFKRQLKACDALLAGLPADRDAWPAMVQGFVEQQRAETARIEMEQAKGTANMQSQLASAQVGVQIRTNEAQAREAEARGEAAYVQLTGEAEAARTQAIGLAQAKATEALGLARAAGFEAQKRALYNTALFPVIMLVSYLVLLAYFRMRGGYGAEVLHIEGESRKPAT